VRILFLGEKQYTFTATQIVERSRYTWYTILIQWE